MTEGTLEEQIKSHLADKALEHHEKARSLIDDQHKVATTDWNDYLLSHAKAQAYSKALKYINELYMKMRVKGGYHV